MEIVGVVLLVLGMMMGIGSKLPAFIDPPSVIIVITFVLGVLLMSGTRIGSMVALFFTTTSGGPEELALAAQGWGLTRQASVAAGAVGTLVGVVIMLKNVDDLAAIGLGIAIGLLTMLYGLVIGYGFCLRVRSIWKHAPVSDIYRKERSWGMDLHQKPNILRPLR